MRKAVLSFWPAQCSQVLVGVLLLLGLTSLIGAPSADAAVRSSASYAVTIDADTSGGGRAGSPSFRQLDSACGEAAYGLSASASYAECAGVVQAWSLDAGAGPTVVAVEVVTPQTVRVTFSALMGAGVTDPANYTITGDGGEGDLNAHPDSVALLFGTRYLLTWNTGSMMSDGTITITVNPLVQDLAGHSMGFPNSGSAPTLGPGLDEFHVPSFEWGSCVKSAEAAKPGG